MISLFNTPVWFNGWDLVFEAISLVVAFLIAGYSWRLFRLSKENKYMYFSLAFILVAIGLIFKIGTSGTVYFTPIRDAAASVFRPVAGQSLQYSGLFYRAGFFLQMVPLLGAWLLIFFISQKSRQRLKKYYEVSQIALYVYLILLISVVGNFRYFIFYLTSAVILGLIVLNYYKNYLNTNRNKNAFKVMLAFVFILIGNLFSVFVFLGNSFYVIGEFFMLIGFLVLLYTYNKIMRRLR
jgi:hypothetical protein